MNNRSKILVSAEQLILAQGWKSTSINMICAHAQISKGAFFYYFKGKDALGIALVSFAGERMAQAMMASVPGSDSSHVRLMTFLNGLIAYADSGQAEQGCVIGILGQEHSLSHPDLQVAIQAVFKPVMTMFEEMLSAVVAERNLSSSAIDAPGIAKMWLTIMQGSLLLTRCVGEDVFLSSNLQLFYDYVIKTLGES